MIARGKCLAGHTILAWEFQGTISVSNKDEYRHEGYVGALMPTLDCALATGYALWTPKGYSRRLPQP